MMKGRRTPRWANLLLTTGLAVFGAMEATQVYAATSKDSLLLLGPVEATDTEKKSITVLGQKVLVGSLNTPAVGTSIAVYGRIQPDGVVVASNIQARDLYVPGADSIVASGVISAVDQSTGRFRIGALEVDFTAAVALTASSLTTGSIVQLVGTQPAYAGLVLADQLSVTTKTGIIGGGLKLEGIIGGGIISTDGIIGGGKLTVDGIIGGGEVATDGIIGGGIVSAEGIIGGGKVSTTGIIGGGLL